MSSVGQALGGIVGGVVGFFVGGPTGALYGAQIGMGVGGLIDPPKGPNINGPRLSDLSVQTSTYGVPIPRVYGTIATHGNVIWLEGDKLKEVATKTKQGGKGGPSATTTTYSYFATFAVGLCKGPIAGVRRIWVGANLIYDAGADDIESIIASNEAAQGFAVYLGTDDQQTDPRMQADKGVANTPAYRGLAYIVFYDLALKDYGNSLQAAQVKVEVVKNAAFQLPSYIGPAPSMQGEIVYASDGIITTAEVGAREFFTDTDAVRKFKGSIIFRDYAQGTLVATRITSAVVPRGSVAENLTWFRTGFLTGSRNEAVVTQIVDKLIGFSSYKEHLSFVGIDSISDGNFGHKIAESKFLLRDVGNAIYIDGETVSELTYPIGPQGRLSSAYQTFNCSTDSITGAIYISIRASSTGHYEIIEIDSDADYVASWTFNYGSFPHFIYAYGDRLVITDALTASRRLVLYDKSGATLTEVASASGGDSSNYAYGNGIAIHGSGLWQVTDRLSEAPVILSDIVGAEVGLSGLVTALDIDASGLTQSVRGYRVAQIGAIRGALEPLQAAWPFDAIQAGYQLAFRPRGGGTVATIPADQLDARSAGDAPGTQLTIAREMDTQIPRRVVVRYLDTAREYDISEQAGERLSTDSIHLREVELPIVLTATEAAGMAEVLLYLYWLERRDVSFRLPPAYRYLEPADVITVTGEWGQYELRLTTVHLMSDGRIECQARYNAAAIYTPTAQGEEGASVGKPIALAGPSYYALLDIPLLRNQDDAPGFPAAMAGYTSGWPGGILFRSPDDGQTWTALQGFDGPATLGFARTALAAGRTDIIDAASVLQVDMLAGALESVTELAMLSGANYFALGADGRWEIIAARTCELQPDGSYILRDFLRGRFGTEWAMTTHQAGDVLVLLTDPDLAWIGMDADAIGLARDYRGITSGRTIDTDQDRAFTYRAVNLEPLSPVYLNGSRHPTTGDWSLSWIRRGRVSPAWRNSVDVPLGEASEAYEVEIYDGAGYATVKRTLSVTAASASYTSAQQVADFGGNQGTLYLRIYQLSATVGRGYPLQTSITR